MEVTEETLSTATVMTNDTWEDEGWLESVSYRDYYAYDVTNADELNEFPNGWGETPTFELKGPFCFKVTTERVFVNHNASAANYEYTESSSFESCFDVDCEGNGPGEDPREPLSNLNVPYATLRVATLPQVFEIIRDAMEARFAMLMLQEESVDTNFSDCFANDADYLEFLNGGAGTKNPTGILAEGPASEPIYYGVTNFLDSANSNSEQTMSDYGIISNSCMDDIMQWTGNWHDGSSTYEVSGEYLVDSEGDPYSENATENITASDYANMSFGGVDPLDGSLPLFAVSYTHLTLPTKA